MSEERRSAKLHKQTEVEDDDAGDDARNESESVCGGIPTPTIQSASSSSGTSPDESPPKVVVPHQIIRKQTLIRGVALEGTSPPPESFFSQIPPNGTLPDTRCLLAHGATGTSIEKNGKKKGQSHEAKEFLLASHKVSNDSGHGTIDHNDGASDTSVLSRDSSLENASSRDIYKDSSGVNIPKFMRDTLLKSAKDKKTILSYEDQLLNFINNESAQTHKMAEMTSYDRMIVHRLAAYLGLEHNVDSTGKCVILSRTANTRSVKLSDLIMFEDAKQEPKKKILLKKPQSLDEKHSARNSKAQFGTIRAKSLEERQQNYIEARERIFSQAEEVQAEGMSVAPQFLSANYIPHIYQQRSQDSTRSNSQLSSSGYGTECGSLSGARVQASMTKTNSFGGTATDPSLSHLGFGARRALSLSKAESLKDSPNTQYSPVNHHPSSQLPTPNATPSDHMHVSQSTPDTGPSPITSSHQCPQLAYLVSNDYSSIPVGSLIINPMTMQPHINADGSLYHFDPTCPPPFMMQPTMHPAQAHIVYQSENVSDLAARFALTSVGSIDQGSDSYTAGIPGQAIPIVPTVVPHLQPVYSPAHPAQFTQGQYFVSPSPATSQQPVRYITFPYQGQQLLQATPVDGQGQTTVPMPAIGIQAMPGAGGYQLMGPPFQQSLASGNPAHCVDYNTATYHYGSISETVVVGRTGAHSSPATAATIGVPAAPHLILACPQPQQGHSAAPQQQQQSAFISSQQAQYTPTGNTPQGTYYTVPSSTPTPPLPITQPPPSSQQQQQQHQPTIFYTPSIVSPLTYQASISTQSQSSSSSSTLKSVPTQFIQTQYRPSSPPQQQQQPQMHQQQSTLMAPSNGHHPTQLTLNYGQTVPFNPSQPLGPVSTAQGSQIVTFQPNTYQMSRPMGTAVIQLTGSPVVQTQQPGSAAQVQSYQLLRPADVRMVNPTTVRPRLSSVQITSPNSSHQPRAKTNSQHRHPKKGGKKSVSRDSDEYQDPQSASFTQHQHLGHPGSTVPLGLPGSIPQPQVLPSSSSNRQ